MLAGADNPGSCKALGRSNLEDSTDSTQGTTPSNGHGQAIPGAFGYINPIMIPGYKYFDRQNKAKCPRGLRPFCCNFPVDLTTGEARWCRECKMSLFF